MQSSRKRTLATYAVLVFSIPILYGGCNPCGNGKLDPGEQCDDGNNTPLDGCSPTCKNETPTACTSITGSALLAAAGSADREFGSYLTLASSQNLNTTNIVSALACNEGNGATAYMGIVKNNNGHKPDGFILTRVDQGIDAKTVLVYGNPNQAEYARTGPGLFKIDRSVTPNTVTMLDPDTGAIIPFTAAMPAAAALPEAESAPPAAGGEATTAEPLTPPDGVLMVQQPSIQALSVGADLTTPTAPCSFTTPAARECWQHHFSRPENQLGIISFVAGAVDAIIAGTLSTLGGVSLGATAVGTFWGLGDCTGKLHPCVDEFCHLGACDLITGKCGPVSAPPTPTAYICDDSCQTCKVDANGEGYCDGIRIDDVSLSTGADVPDSGNCSAHRDNPANVIIRFCGRTTGTSIVTEEDFWANGPCPEGWGCFNKTSQFRPSPLKSPHVMEKWVGCCSNLSANPRTCTSLTDTVGCLPVTFNAVAIICDSGPGSCSQFFPFQWNCVKSDLTGH